MLKGSLVSHLFRLLEFNYAKTSLSQQIRLHVAHMLSCLNTPAQFGVKQNNFSTLRTQLDISTRNCLYDCKTKVLLIDCSLFYASTFMICLKVQTSNCEAWKCILMSLTRHIECHLSGLFKSNRSCCRRLDLYKQTILFL